MKQQQIELTDIEEMEILRDQLDSRDLFLLGFLKGFNRTNMQEWSRKELSVFSTQYA